MMDLCSEEYCLRLGQSKSMMGIAPEKVFLLPRFTAILFHYHFQSHFLSSLLFSECRWIHHGYDPKVKEISNKMGLYLHVHWGTTGEGWGKIDFNEPRFEVAVNENIKSIKLEAIVCMRNIRLNGSCDWQFPCNDRLDDDLFNSCK
eukprot:m.117687 g.117687  ORF g.117687 m.117687 type:complete len:146 (-) comp12878_c0_seq2:1746-2183(-)